MSKRYHGLYVRGVSISQLLLVPYAPSEIPRTLCPWSLNFSATTRPLRSVRDTTDFISVEFQFLSYYSSLTLRQRYHGLYVRGVLNFSATTRPLRSVRDTTDFISVEFQFLSYYSSLTL